jgi:hypothetical protein
LSTSAPNVNKYFKIHELYFTENDFLNTANYGLTRQHNLISPAATTNNFSTFFDTTSSDHLINYTLGYTVTI